MKKVLLFSFLLSFCLAKAQKLEGQKLIDSLLVELPKMKEDTLKVIALNKLGFAYMGLEPNKGMEIVKQSLQLSQKIKYKKGVTLGYKGIASSYAFKDDYQNSISYYNLALKSTNDSKLVGQIYTGLGYVYMQMNNYPLALQYHFKALKIHEKSNRLVSQALTLNNIGTTFNNLKQPKKAIESFEKALKINRNLGSEMEEIRNLGNLGTSYNDLHQYQKALSYFAKALSLSKKNNQVGSATINLYSTGLAYYNLKRYNQSISFTNQSLGLSLETDNKMGLVKNYGLLGDNYLEKSKVEKNNSVKTGFLKLSESNFSKSITISKEINELLDLGNNLGRVSEVQKSLGNYKAALDSHEQYVIYKDSVFNSENKETIKNLEDKRKIELRDKEIKINKLSLEAKEKQKWYLLGGLGLLTIIGGLLFYQSRKRKQINTKLQVLNQNLDTKNLELDQANKAKTRFFSILNHDLRGPVANLIFFLQLQNESPEMLDEESTKRMQDKTMTGAENLLASMEDILQWSKSQMENFKPQPKNLSVNQLFDDTKKVFSGYLKITFEYHNPDNIEIFTDENYLKTIVRNLTSNAINIFTSTENPTIIWKAWQTNNQSFLSVTDNGPGASEEKFNALFDEAEIGSTKSGLGLHLIRDMAKAIDCEITVDSEVGVGTTFSLIL
jgi:signal transduction histidine kinase/tetratricopeptide (TPR) repeat protein